MSIGGHHSARAGTVEWLTPPEIIVALGGWESFAVDPCAPPIERRPWPTARAHFTEAEDGLSRPWQGRAWLNPPYTTALMHQWMARMAEHNHGTALTFARTETSWFFRYIWRCATAILFMETPRLHFYENLATPWTGDPWRWFSRRAEANCGGPTVLCAYGIDDADRLAAAALPGAFVPLTGSGQMVAVFRPANDGITWTALIAEIASRAGGKLTVAAAYVLVAQHPKAAANQNWKAQVRKILQCSKFERVAPATYQLRGVA